MRISFLPLRTANRSPGTYPYRVQWMRQAERASCCRRRMRLPMQHLRCRPRRSNRILNALTNGLRSGACVRPSPTLHSARRRKAASRMRCSNASLSASAKRASRRWARTTSSGRARCSARFLTSAWQLSVHSGPRTIRSSPAPSSKRPSWTICAVNSPRSSNASRSCCQASSRRISSSTSAHTNPSSMPTVFCAAASIASM